MTRKMMRDVNNNKNTCRTLVNHNPQEYVVSITIPQPKIRVKIPKLLMKTIQMNNNNNNNNQGGVFCSESDETIHNQTKTTPNKKKKNKKRGLTSLLSSVFGATKASKDEMGHQNHNLNLPSMFKRHSLKEHFEATKADEQHKRKKNIGLSFIKEKVKNNKKSTYSGSNVGTVSICSSSSSGCSSGNSCQLPKAPLRVLTARDKSSRMARSSSLKKMASKRLAGVGGGGEAEMVEERGGRTESGSDKELCKKRILMGEKCKPMNYSGTLEYDKEGMLLPDTFSW